MYFNQAKQGFTLIELLVVVLIIGILAAVAVPQYQKAVYKSRYATIKNLVNNAIAAQEVYFLANGVYADDLEKLDIGLSTRYDWGIVACISSDCYARYRKGNFSMQYGQFLQHAPRSAGMRYCVAEQSDDDTTLAAQICQSETGKKTADEQGTIDSIGGFFLYYY